MVPVVGPTTQFTHLDQKPMKPWSVQSLESVVASISPQNTIKSGFVVQGGIGVKLVMSGREDFIVSNSDRVHSFLAKHGVDLSVNN